MNTIILYQHRSGSRERADGLSQDGESGPVSDVAAWKDPDHEIGVSDLRDLFLCMLENGLQICSSAPIATNEAARVAIRW